jgi:hypothetical protein
LVEQELTLQEKQTILSIIKENIYLFRLSFNEDHTDYEPKLLTWRMLENRYHRTQRLVYLGAPKIIVLHEIKWLSIMIDHMDKRYREIEPQFTNEELEELEMEKQV